MNQSRQKIAYITGASRGIGAATAIYLAEQGYSVALLARSLADIEALASRINEQGGSALARQLDVADATAFADTVADVSAELGAPSLLLNNAGTIDPIARLADSQPADWSRVIDVNIKGVYNGVHAVLPGMLAQGGGTIVNISSGAAHNPLEGWSHYCVSKAGVYMLTQSVHKEYEDHGIRSIGLSPGTVATDMQRSIKASGINPVSKLDFDSHIPPEWVAKAVHFLDGAEADEFLGRDFTLKSDRERALAGLPPVGESA